MIDKDKPFDKEAQDSVQSYLDLLLSKPTEIPDCVAVGSLGGKKAEAQAESSDIPGKENKLLDEGALVLESNEQVRRLTRQQGPARNSASPETEDRVSSSLIQTGHLTQVQRFTPTLRRKRDYQDRLEAVEKRSFARPLKPPLLKFPLPEVHVAAQEKPPLASIDKPRDIDSKSIEIIPSAKVIDEPALEPAKELSERPVGLSTLHPPWAQQRFECLLFTVCGLTLAVPLTELGAIYPITDRLTPIFGQVDWFLGLLPVKDRNIRVINTAKVVMPERFDEKTAEQYNYVISINGVDWGLAAEGVTSSISLDPENIKWRGKRSKRPWLAGTVVEHMCGLLDVSQLTLMFVEHNK